MKRYLLVSFLTLFLFVAPILAQDAPITTPSASPQEQALAVYQQEFDRYRAAHTTYITAQSDWAATGTLKSELAALNAAKAAATARASVYIAYTRYLRLQLSSLASIYPQVNPKLAQLDILLSWYTSHLSQISSADTIANFDNVMNRYADFIPQKDKTYASAQISLKLAQLASIQHEARALYDPLLADLQPKSNIAEVEQGMARVHALGEDINTLIEQTLAITGSLESNDLNTKSAFQKAIPNLDGIRSRQLALIGYLIELESRYYGQ